MQLTPEEAKDITDRRLAASRADGCIVDVDGGDDLNLRFARNSATSNGARSAIDVTIESQFGQQSGSATVTSLDDGSARPRRSAARRRSPGSLPPIPNRCRRSARSITLPEWPTMRRPPALRAAEMAAARAAAPSPGPSVRRRRRARAMPRSEPNSAPWRPAPACSPMTAKTDAAFTITARRKDGSWSGWAGGSEFRFGGLDADAIAGRAVAKAAHSQPPLDLDPGQYTVILEPSAVGEMLQYLLWSMDARVGG